MIRLPHPAAVVLAGLLGLAACAPAATGPCADQSVTLETTVTADAMEPATLETCRDQEVTIEVTAETDGVFHIGGYEETVALTLWIIAQPIVIEPA